MDWDAERTLDAAQAAALIDARFPDLRGAPVTAAGEGWDNTVFRVREDLVFRFPRRAIALPGIRREIAHLPRLAPELPLPIPVPTYLGEPGDDFDWPFWGGPFVDGTELTVAGLDEAARGPAAVEVGAFLAALHAPRIAADHPDLPPDPMHRGDPAWRSRFHRDWLAKLVATGTEVPPAVEALLDAGDRLPPPAGEPVVVHGDLHFRHLLVRPDGSAAGVIDWGDLALGDPAVDLSLGFAAFTGAARRAFRDAYGPIDAERELRARVLASGLCVVLATQAAHDGRPALHAEAMAGLRRAVD